MNDEKEFSLVVFGASGFTGRLVAEYLAAQYGDNLKWAMAGRNEEKLKSVREEIVARHANGEKKLLVKYQGEGSQEVIIHRTE